MVQRGGVVVRRATDDDRSAILDLCRASLGWKLDDPNEAFFAWKHDDNAFGRSPAWVALDDGRLIGLRCFLRWRFRGADGTVLHGVRAVDTATHPDAQGRGIFTTLTMGALPDLRADGVDFVFNTPNDKSRPGYLKMGWSTVGRVPVGVRAASPGSLLRTARARTGAELWSEPTDVGEPAADVLADHDAVARLLTAVPSPRLHTDRDPAYLSWRFGFEPLRYRAVLLGREIEDGLVVVRVRRRGPSLEGVVAETLAPEGRSLRGVLADVAKQTGVDHLIRCGPASMIRDGFVPTPPLGPILTWRPIGRPGVPPVSAVALSLGDIELF